MTITPSAAAEAYARTAREAAGGATGGTAPDFGAVMEQALDQAVETGHKADDQAMKAINGSGNLTEVVAALSHAEMTLQTATVIRDRVVQAYQDIIKMPI